MITFMQFIIALYGLYNAAKEARGEMSMKEWIDKVNGTVKKAQEAQTDAEKLEAAASLVDCLK